MQQKIKLPFVKLLCCWQKVQLILISATGTMLIILNALIAAINGPNEEAILPGTCGNAVVDRKQMMAIVHECHGCNSAHSCKYDSFCSKGSGSLFIVATCFCYSRVSSGTRTVARQE